jgi:uncharacterized RDD family membrane protein YckC
MQTWRIRLVAADGARISQARALARYIACCIAWFAPAMGVAATLHLGPWPTLVAAVFGIVIYALLALAAPGRQFWHDIVCGTRLVDTRGEPVPVRR